MSNIQVSVPTGGSDGGHGLRNAIILFLLLVAIFVGFVGLKSSILNQKFTDAFHKKEWWKKWKCG